jgi:hypothetical protein
MPQDSHLSSNSPKQSRRRPSLDVWAVVLALVLAALIWTGVIRHIP